jgi:hypothetical protein
MRRAIETLVFVLCVVLSVAGAYNVLSDNAEVEKMAEATACKGEGETPKAPAQPACRPQKTRMERTPIAQTFDFQAGKKTVVVRCTRAFVFAGDYACEPR